MMQTCGAGSNWGSADSSTGQACIHGNQASLVAACNRAAIRLVPGERPPVAEAHEKTATARSAHVQDFLFLPRDTVFG